MNDLGKMLLGLGLLLAVIGAVLLLAERFGLPLGRLPGDFAYKGKTFQSTFLLARASLSASCYRLCCTYSRAFATSPAAEH